MKIRDLQIQRVGEHTRVSADLGGFELWYKVPSMFPVSHIADPFVAAGLLPAMYMGEPLELDGGLLMSGKLRSNLYKLQEIYNTWNPNFKLIEIKSDKFAVNRAAINKGAISFFSGGVDSTYTFLKRNNVLTHVVYINGFDFFENQDEFEIAIHRNNEFISGFGKTLIPVETNFYHFGYKYNFSRNLTQGSHLGSVALLLGFPRTFIPSSFSYNQIFPLGSHPLTDPLWSTGYMEVFHDGCEANRTEKIIKICENESSLSNLRVCFQAMNKNCGRCEKCIRTLIILNLLNIQTDAFPKIPSLKVIRKHAINGKIELDFLKESVDLAKQFKSTKLSKAISKSLERHRIKQLYRDLDSVFLNGLLLKIYKRHFISKSYHRSIDTTPSS